MAKAKKRTYVRPEWMSVIPRVDALDEQDTLFFSTLDAVIPAQGMTAADKPVERAFSDWLDAGREAKLLTGADAARLWKALAAPLS